MVSWAGRSPNFGCRSRHHLGSGRAPALQIRNGKISPVRQWLLSGGTHGYVNVLENFPGRDSQRAIGGFHKIVASLPAMFTSERIPKLEGTGELPGPDQKSRAIDLPFAFCFPHVIPPLGEGRFLVFGCRQSAVSLAGFSVKVKKNLRAIGGVVNPQVRCKSQILGKKFSRTLRDERNREQTLLEPRYGSRQAAEQQINASHSREFSTSRRLESRRVLSAAAWRRTLPCACMPDEVNLRGQGSFPATRWSLIAAARSAEPEARQRALEILVAAYWKPVYKYIRLRWDKDNEQAQDLTQDFFVRLLEKDFLAHYEPHRARLRTFLRVCVDHLVANEDKAARRLKRGGEVQFLRLDFESAEGELQQIEIPSPGSMEDFFEREWVRSVFSLSLERLRQECEHGGKLVHFRLLEFYDIDEGGKELTYEQVARQFGLKPSDVTNYLAFARREFRRIVLDQLREMTGSEEEFRREAHTLLGIDAP